MHFVHPTVDGRCYAKTWQHIADIRNYRFHVAYESSPLGNNKIVLKMIDSLIDEVQAWPFITEDKYLSSPDYHWEHY